MPPEGRAESREGNILITISHAYYRHFNDGDDFSDQLDINGMSELFDMKNSIDKTFLRNIYNKSYDPDEAVNETMRYLMISMSTKEKISEKEVVLTDLAHENEIILYQTVFYPHGGGQPGDTGELQWNDKAIKIINTFNMFIIIQ